MGWTRTQRGGWLAAVLATALFAVGCGDDDSNTTDEPVGLSSAEICERLDADAASNAAGMQVRSAEPGTGPDDPRPPNCIYAIDDDFITLGVMRPDDDLLGRDIASGYELMVGFSGATEENSASIDDVGDEALLIEMEQLVQVLARGDGMVITVAAAPSTGPDPATAMARAFLSP